LVAGLLVLFWPQRNPGPEIGDHAPPAAQQNQPIMQQNPALPQAPGEHQQTAFSNVSDTELKGFIASAAEELRKLEADYDGKRGAITSAPLHWMTVEEQRLEYAERTNKLDALQNEETLLFQKKHLPEIRTLVLELGIRLNRKRPGGNTQPQGYGDAPIVLGNGILTPRTPLRDLAGWLEAYAAEL
jgi:hypothetical protein